MSLICNSFIVQRSIIYNKPFYSYERFSSKDENNQNSRIYNILKLLKLENRLVKDKTSIPAQPFNCEYNDTNKQLEKKYHESIEFLEKALREAVNDNSSSEYKITNTCCGCGACSIICPTNAIEIKRDNKGFLKYFITEEKCIRCKKCKTVCPFNNKKSIDINKDIHNLYMLKSIDKNVLSTHLLEEQDLR